jgi:glucose-6-phosphate isomerase
MLPTFDLDSGALGGEQLTAKEVCLGDLKGIFFDESARAAMDPGTSIYQTQLLQTAPADKEGALLWGTTSIQPGMVGDEYFMTRGHFHNVRNRAEFYLTLRGDGILLLMEKNRQVRSEPMRRGTLHYIPGETAHRAVNTGKDELTFTACWSADAGHDYESILRNGFAARVRCIAGKPELVLMGHP